MENQVYFHAEIHFTRPSQTAGFFGRLRNDIDFCHFTHLVLATDIKEARKKAEAFADNFFSGDVGGKLLAVKVNETIL